MGKALWKMKKIKKPLESAKEIKVEEFLMDTKESIPIKKALDRAKKRWCKKTSRNGSK